MNKRNDVVKMTEALPLALLDLQPKIAMTQTLEAAESVSLQMTDDDLKALFGVYWELATGEDIPGDFKRLADERLATSYPKNGCEMREIREQKELRVCHEISVSLFLQN